MVSVGDNGLTVGEIIRRIRPVLDRSSAVKAWVFGSWARGTQTRRSDIDLMISATTRKPRFQRVDEFLGLFEALDGHPLDVLIYTPEEIRTSAERPFFADILNKGIAVYER
jgi:uncharacterized protein